MMGAVGRGHESADEEGALSRECRDTSGEKSGRQKEMPNRAHLLLSAELGLFPHLIFTVHTIVTIPADPCRLRTWMRYGRQSVAGGEEGEEEEEEQEEEALRSIYRTYTGACTSLCPMYGMSFLTC